MAVFDQAHTLKNASGASAAANSTPASGNHLKFQRPMVDISTLQGRDYATVAVARHLHDALQNPVLKMASASGKLRRGTATPSQVVESVQDIYAVAEEFLALPMNGVTKETFGKLGLDEQKISAQELHDALVAVSNALRTHVGNKAIDLVGGFDTSADSAPEAALREVKAAEAAFALFLPALRNVKAYMLKNPEAPEDGRELDLGLKES